MSVWSSGHRIKLAFLIASLVELGLSACAAGPFATDGQEMQSLGSALTKLSSAVDVTVAFEELPEDISEQELLVYSTQHDPELLTRFDGYRLRVMNLDKYVVLLVCSETEDRALLEDATCTAQLDRHAWREKTSCEFTLTDSRLCELP